MVYSTSCLYLPFDSSEITLRAVDLFDKLSSNSNFTAGSFVSGPINEAYCTSAADSMKLADIKSDCFYNFANCPDGFSLTFWIKSASLDHLAPNETFSILSFDGFSLLYRSDLQNVNKLTLVIEKSNATSTCKYLTKIPANVWVHLSLVLTSTNVEAYIHGNFVNIFKFECQGTEAYVRKKVVTLGGIGHSFCIDDLSVWITPLSSSNVSRIYEKGKYSVDLLHESLLLLLSYSLYDVYL